MILTKILLQLISISLIYNDFTKCDSPPTNVIEIDDRIIEFSKQGKWLVKFYAPWCGHCKKLEPIYEEIGKHFSNSNVHVVKIDATKYVKAANHFEIRGYPSIKFISGNSVFSFNGDRKTNDIIEFVEKADGPKIRRILSKNDYLNAKSKQKIFFFLIIQNEDEASILRTNYITLAEKYFLDSYFFMCTTPDVISKEINTNDLPKVIVVKEENYYKYSSNNENLNELEKFIKTEQFLSFTPVSITNFHSLVESRKILLILLLSDIDLVTSKKFKEIFKSYSESHREIQTEFQIGFTETNDLLNNIAIWSLQGPLLFILNATNYKYSVVYFEKENLPNLKDIETIIQNIRDFKYDFHGGDGWFRHLRRPFWELYRGVLEMFIEAPFISMLIFGIPFGVISIVCYFLCCFEASESVEYEEIAEDSELEDDEINQNFESVEDEIMIEEGVVTEDIKKNN